MSGRVDYAALTERRCSACEKTLPIAAFGKYNSPSAPLTGWRYHSRCIECGRAASRAQGIANRERRNQRLAAWRQANPDAAHALDRRKYERRRARASLEMANQ